VVTNIDPRLVRYIKLGQGGGWEAECIGDGIIRFGFSTARGDRFAMASDGRWADLTASFITEGRGPGTATRFTNETKLFFQDDGRTLWLTFHGASLYWGFLTPESAERHPDGDGVLRRVDGGWKNHDLLGEPLTTDRLSGALTKLAAYRGTSCGVDVAGYAVRRINGQKIPEVESAISAVAAMHASALELMRQLGPRDFETLIDLVFSRSGWQRQGVVGKTQKALDLDLLLPTTGDRAFVQVKSKTSPADLTEYLARLDELVIYDRMFFVYHTGMIETDDDRVTLLGPDKLPAMVVEAGLVDWLIRKVS
jgi:hypothetical protein